MSAAEEGRSLGELVASAAEELSGLVQDEIALAKAQIKQDVQRALWGIIAVAVGAVLALFALALLSFAVAEGLHEWWGWPIGVTLALVGGVYLAATAGLVVFAVRKFGRLGSSGRAVRSAQSSAAVLTHVKPHPRAVPADRAGSAP
ncbi:phage holin family protein [Streptomyces specialis]|uniref:phage holin family protein n=1 Tax=Streptomyces specialis TaxID=498367 RepID=UPI00073E2E44|nr:phage holin family protein [Streptomyces specialis]